MASGGAGKDRKLCLTYESRYGEEIARLERWALKVVGGGSSGSAGAALTLANRLGSLHEQLGWPYCLDLVGWYDV